jgi:hypothetical protein
MNIVPLRIHFTGSRRRDLVCGVLSGLGAWALGGLVFRLLGEPGLPQVQPWKGFGFPHLLTAGLLFIAFAATVHGLSRRPYARAFLHAMVVTAAIVPPLVTWAFLVFFLPAPRLTSQTLGSAAAQATEIGMP